MAFTLFLLSLLAVSSLAQFQGFDSHRGFGGGDRDDPFDFHDDDGFHPGNSFSHAGPSSGQYGPRQPHPHGPKRKYLTCRMYNDYGDRFEATITEDDDASHNSHAPNPFHFGGGSHHGGFNSLHGFLGGGGGGNLDLFGKNPNKGGKLRVYGRYKSGKAPDGLKGKLHLVFTEYGNIASECQGLGSMLRKKSKSSRSPFGNSHFPGSHNPFGGIFGSHFNTPFGHHGQSLFGLGTGHANFHGLGGATGQGGKSQSPFVMVDHYIDADADTASLNGYLHEDMKALAGRGCSLCYKTPYGKCEYSSLCGSVVHDGHSIDGFKDYIDHKNIIKKVQLEKFQAAQNSGGFQFPGPSGAGGASQLLGSSSRGGNPGLF